MKTKLFIISLIFVLANLAQAQTVTKPENEGKAIVYFYSLATIRTIGQVKKPVFLDDKEIAEIRPERYFIALLDPGKHSFRLKNKKFGGIEMDFEAGKTYYIRIGWTSDGILKPTGISLIPVESGAYDIKHLRPVDAKNIKNREIAFTELTK